jgi:hypothetical protein
MTPSLDAYRTQSVWTDPGPFASRLHAIPPDPLGVVEAVSGLLTHPMIAPAQGIFMPAAAADDRIIRSVEAILDRLVTRDSSGLTSPRTTEGRVFCVCAGFARVATAVFRTHGVPARCRVGFARYFSPSLEDHWVCEYWDGAAWHLLDAQLGPHTARGAAPAFPPHDVPRDQFLDASTAWRRMRAGELDPSTMGLSFLGLTGAWFVAGNVMLDAAALNKEEMLPWEKWSVGRELGPGSTVSPALAERFDAVAAALAGSPDAATAARVYREHEWLRVTPTVLSFAEHPPAEVPGHR